MEKTGFVGDSSREAIRYRVMASGILVFGGLFVCLGIGVLVPLLTREILPGYARVPLSFIAIAFGYLVGRRFPGAFPPFPYGRPASTLREPWFRAGSFLVTRIGGDDRPWWRRMFAIRTWAGLSWSKG